MFHSLQLTQHSQCNAESWKHKSVIRYQIVPQPDTRYGKQTTWPVAQRLASFYALYSVCLASSASLVCPRKGFRMWKIRLFLLGFFEDMVL